MDPVTQVLSLLAVVILVGALGEVITKKTQIPDVIWLILFGIILGPVTGIIDSAALANNATGIKLFASITLIIVLFEGGSRLKLGELAQAAPRAALLSVTGFIITVLSVAVVSQAVTWFADLIPDAHDAYAELLFDVMGAPHALPSSGGWTFLHGIMLGAIIGGSSSLIVMPSMNLAKLDEKVSNLVGLESALTDALCVVVTLAMISILTASGGETSSPFATLGQQFGIAILVGSVAAWCWMPIMRLLRGSPQAYPVTLSALIVLYVAIDQMGGSAALGILAFAIVVGNARAIVSKLGFNSESPVGLGDSVRDVNSNIAFLIKSLFFCFIGLMIGPPWGMVLAGIVLGFVLLAVRIPAVWIATRGAGLTLQDQKIVTVSLPRGMAAGVLATIPHGAGVVGTENLPPLVFAAVVTTILVFAVGFPLVSRGAGSSESEPGPEGEASSSDAPFEPRPPGVLTEPLLPSVAGEGAAEVVEAAEAAGEVASESAEAASEVESEQGAVAGEAVVASPVEAVEDAPEAATAAGEVALESGDEGLDTGAQVPEKPEQG